MTRRIQGNLVKSLRASLTGQICGWQADCRKWRSNPCGKCSQQRLTRATVTSTMRRAAHLSGWASCSAGCSAMKYQSLAGGLGSRADGGARHRSLRGVRHLPAARPTSGVSSHPSGMFLAIRNRSRFFCTHETVPRGGARHRPFRGVRHHPAAREREFFIDNLLVRIRPIIETT